VAKGEDGMMEKQTRQTPSGDWETRLTVAVDLEYSTINVVFENLRLAMESLVKEGIPREEIKFDIETRAYHDGEIDVTHTLEAVRPATPKEIGHARATVTLAEHTRESQLRRELAEIERRKVEKR
jgi:hypothetical protein